MTIKKHDRREKRKRRVRGKINGTSDRPRLSVFRSNRHIYAQLIDDEEGKTLVAASDFDLEEGGSNKEVAFKVGQCLAEKANDQNIGKAVFDRGGYKYHGRVEAVADGVRDGGLDF